MVALWLITLLLTFGIWFSHPVGVSADDPIHLSYANFSSVDSLSGIQMERWKTEIENQTQGQVVVDTFPNGSRLDAKSMMDGILGGKADIGCLWLASEPGRFLITAATALPLQIPDARTGSMVLLDLYQKYLPQELAGVKILAMFTSAPVHLLTTVPIRSLNNILGLDIEASGSTAQILAAWQANPVGMPMAAAREALRMGVVKGLLAPANLLKDQTYAQVCHYATLTATAVYPFAVVMNRESWQKLPESVQQVMTSLVADHSAWTGSFADRQAAEALDWSVKTYQLEIIRLPEDQIKRWNNPLLQLSDEWLKQATAKKVPAEQILADLGSWIRQYSQNQVK
jgi:TRAP-type C4-dicarboxylate transport system substrate-binding protein